MTEKIEVKDENNIFELIAKAKQGDSDAMQQIFSAYKSLIRSIVNKFFLVLGDKDDLFQEGMLGLFKAVIDFDQSKGAFPSFVKLCVFRSVVSAVKSENSNKNKPLANYVELTDLSDIVFSQGSPLDEIVSTEAAEAFKKTIENNLSKTERLVLDLFLEGFSYFEISEKTGKSTKSIDGAMQRARKKLTSLLPLSESNSRLK